MQKFVIGFSILLIAGISFLALMVFIRGEEDTWLNVNGNWVEHGVPYAPPPRCVIQNCHGLEIDCGPNPPDMCTMQYKLGDFCRQFAQCAIVGSDCVQIESPDLEACKICVENCGQGGEDAWECELNCRELFK